MLSSGRQQKCSQRVLSKCLEVSSDIIANKFNNANLKIVITLNFWMTSIAHINF